MRESMTDRSKHRIRHAVLVLGLSALLTGTTSLTAAAQQAYFRGEAEPDNSVIVNLSVIDKLTSGAPSTAPQTFGTPMPVAPPAQMQAPMPQAVAPQSAVPQTAAPSNVAPPPSAAPRSTLLVDPATGSPAAATPKQAPAPVAPPPKPALADQSAPLPKPTPAPPPPDTQTNTASIPKPAPAPQPAPEPAPEPQATPEPPPQPAPAEPPKSEIAAAPAEPAPPPPAPAPAAAPEPPQPPSSEITPPPSATTEAPAAAEEQPKSDEAPQVASVDLTAVDRAGIASNEDGISVLFTKDSQDLPKAAEVALTELAERVKANDAMTVKLLGYSEPIGEAQSKPRRLALFRALAVRTFLLKQGIDSRRMTVQALGTKDPHEGRAANRVDLIVAEN